MSTCECWFGCACTLSDKARELHKAVMAQLKKPKKRRIVGRVDTYGDTHHAAVVLLNDTHVADAQLPVAATGYTLLLAWLCSFERLFHSWCSEGTGAYGPPVIPLDPQAAVGAAVRSPARCHQARWAFQIQATLRANTDGRDARRWAVGPASNTHISC